MGLVKGDATSEAGRTPSPEVLARVGAPVAEIAQTGILLETDRLQPRAKRKRVRLADAKVTVIDGPFTDSVGVSDRGVAAPSGGRPPWGPSGARGDPTEVKLGTERSSDSHQPVVACVHFHPDSMEEAVALATRFLQALGGGEVELRPVLDPTDLRPQS